MPTSNEAIKRHILYCLAIAETVNNLFLEERTQERSVNIFDRNRGQIDLAILRVLQQDPNNETDIVLARFVDAVSHVGMMRYSVLETLIPLTKHKIVAAQRLGWKDLEADALDGLGIMYAFLGYLQEAVHHFQIAYQIAAQTKDKELERDIKTHLKMAQKQTKNRKITSSLKILNLVRLIWIRLKVLVAQVNKNPFFQVATLNSLASIYLILEKWQLSIRYYQQAIVISREHSYRFGELEASMGLLQAEMSREVRRDTSISASTVGNLISEFGFEWNNDFFVFETLLEIAPAIRSVEIIANEYAKNNDPRVNEIYALLDQIMIETNEIVLAVNRGSVQKHEVFVQSLENIKDNLTYIVDISSSNNL